MHTATLTLPGVYGRLSGRGFSNELQKVYDHVLPLVDCSNSVLSGLDGEPLWMEIGFGDGVHLRAQLNKNPHVHFLGVEVFRPGIAQCLKDLSESEQARLRIFPHNVHTLMPLLPDESVEKIFILFPDPWPKRKHHKRRLLHIPFLEQCFRVLQKQGRIVIASDIPSLISWMQSMLSSHGKFSYQQGAKTSDFLEWPAWPVDFPLSRYGRKAVQKTYFIWEKCDIK